MKVTYGATVNELLKQLANDIIDVRDQISDEYSGDIPPILKQFFEQVPEKPEDFLRPELPTPHRQSS